MKPNLLKSSTLPLQTFRLKNFKAVRDSKPIKFTPITIFVGNNGSKNLPRYPGGKNINSITGMPTKKRITVPGAIAHIMARGIDGRDIFSDDADRICFLGLLDSVVSKTGYRCYGWVLMKNHYHLIVRMSEQPLNGLMRVLNSLYANQ
jgi:hypothetical protein